MMLSADFLPGVVVGTLENSALNEASGVVASFDNPGVLWAHNDSGDSPRLFALDTTGKHLGIYNIGDGVTLRDWEDISIGPGPVEGTDYLYISETGDNSSKHTEIKVYRVEEPTVDAGQDPTDVTVTGVDTLTFKYPDGPRDAESLFVDPLNGDIYIITKRPLDNPSRVYRAAYPQSTTSTTTLEFMGELDLIEASAADISADGSEIIVKNRQIAQFYTRGPGASVWDALAAGGHAIPYTVENQGEAVTFDLLGSGYYTISEGAGEPIYYYARAVPNELPVALNDAYSVNEDDVLSISGAAGVLLNDSDADGDPLVAQLVAGPSDGMLTLNADGSFSYTPDGDFFGTDSFTYQAFDGVGTSNVATVTITVDPLPDNPVANNDTYGVIEDAVLVIDTAASGILDNDTDADGDPLTASLLTDVSNGTLVLASDGTFTYTPNASFVGIDTFEYTASDGNGGIDTATVTINVNATTAVVEDYAMSEVTNWGTLLNGTSLTDTLTSDNQYEILEEEPYAGGKRSRASHTWQFNVTGGNAVSVSIEYQTVGGESFQLEFSTDNTNWTALTTSLQSVGADVVETFQLPAATAGPLYLRASDTDRSNKESSLDQLHVDQLFIISDDGGQAPLPTVSITANDPSAAEAGLDPGQMTVSRTGDTGDDLVVSYTVAGTATPDNDYTALTGSVTILAGQSTAVIDVVPLDDGDIEGNETVVVTLAADAAYNLGAQQATAIIADNDGSGTITDDRPIADSSTYGTVSGSTANLDGSDDVYQAITEVPSSNGKWIRPKLDHQWEFSVTGGSSVTFVVEAHQTGGNDSFTFAYSLDGNTWFDMVVIPNTSNSDSVYSYELPSTVSGTVFVRVVDSDRSKNDIGLDTLWIDDMYIRSE